MPDHNLADEAVHLRPWADEDAHWYAEASRDPLIQHFTTESPTLDGAQVLSAIRTLRTSTTDEGFVICDAVTGARLGNMALHHDGTSGEVSYWIAAEGRGRGIAARALALFSTWAFQTLPLNELWLSIHRDNIPSQKTADRAGYQRNPQRDTTKQVKNATWPMLGYTLTAPTHSPTANQHPPEHARRPRTSP